jgi:hypothetical protein
VAAGALAGRRTPDDRNSMKHAPGAPVSVTLAATAAGPAVAGLAATRSQIGGLARLTAQSLRRDLVGRAERLHR